MLGPFEHVAALTTTQYPEKVAGMYAALRDDILQGTSKNVSA